MRRAADYDPTCSVGVQTEQPPVFDMSKLTANPFIQLNVQSSWCEIQALDVFSLHIYLLCLLGDNTIYCYTLREYVQGGKVKKGRVFENFVSRADGSQIYSNKIKSQH